MKHSINELYRVQGANHLLTKEAVELLHRPVYKATHKVHSKDEVRIYDVDCIKTIYMFGEKTWFDTQEELNEHRAQYRKEQEAEMARNKVKRAIMAKLENMPIEQLQRILEEMGA